MRKNSIFLLVVCMGFLLSKWVYAAEGTHSSDLATNKLSCFTINPPPYDKNNPTSCDELCGAKGAVCAGMQNGGVNPPITCSDVPLPNVSACRCCKIDGGKQ